MSAPTQISEAQLAANRSNAQLSTGPRSEAGKSKVALNAVKTGLTGRDAFLPTDDAAKYQAMTDKYLACYEPIGIEEIALVQSVIDLRWRLDRVSAIEQSIFNVGFKKLCEQRPELAGTSIAGHEFEIMEMYEKQLRNLHLQESRLSRRVEKDLQRLTELQKARKHRENIEFTRAAEMRLLAEHRKEPFHFEKNGFVFSKERFEKAFDAIPPEQKQTLLRRLLAKAA